MPAHRPASRLPLPVLLGLALWICFDPARSVAEGTNADPTLETLEQLHEQLEALRSRVHGMEGKLKESARARKGADQARMDAERRLAEGTQALEQARKQVEALETTEAALEQQVSDQKGLISRLGEELQTAQETNAQLTAELDRLRARLPEAEGGALTAAAAREAATTAYTALRDALAQAPTATQSRPQAITRAEAELHRSQLRLARVLGARSVYRVRPRDSLALISNRFYGTSLEWQTLFEANRHLLSNPDRLEPGITLVIP